MSPAPPKSSPSFASPPNRRMVVASLAALAAAAGGQRAVGQTSGRTRPSLPLRMHYARLTPSGLAAPPMEEQAAWRALQIRSGDLIREIAPLPVGGLFNLPPPESDGGAGCILTARQIAESAGVRHVLLYATHDGRRTHAAYDNWLSRAFASLRSEHGPRDPSDGEAHLFDTAGGGPVISVVADARPRQWFNPLDRRRPEAEVLADLISGFEQHVVDMSRDLYRQQGSIAD